MGKSASSDSFSEESALAVPHFPSTSTDIALAGGKVFLVAVAGTLLVVAEVVAGAVILAANLGTVAILAAAQMVLFAAGVVVAFSLVTVILTFPVLICKSLFGILSPGYAISAVLGVLVGLAMFGDAD